MKHNYNMFISKNQINEDSLISESIRLIHLHLAIHNANSMPRTIRGYIRRTEYYLS